MASRPVDDCDGVFVNETENLDEVDASQVFHVSTLRETPSKYIGGGSQGGLWQKTAVARPKMVPDMYGKSKSISYLQMPWRHSSPGHQQIHKDWGRAISRLVEKEGVLILATMDDKVKVTEEFAKTLIKHLQDIVGKYPIQGLRYNEHSVLLNFPSLAAYEEIGGRIVQTQGRTVKDDALIILEGAVICNPPSVYLEVTCRHRDAIHRSLVDAVLPFSSTFTFLELLVDEHSAAPSDSIPTTGITMLFDGGNQRNAERTLRHVRADPWKPISLIPEVASDLDEGLTYYTNSLGGPAWGVRTGCPQAGVQVTIFVQELAKLDAMVTFYKNLFKVTPLSKIETSSGACYRVFPLSARGELMLLHIPGLKTEVCSNVLVCVKAALQDFEGKQDADILSDNRWLLNDPENNRVCVFRSGND